MVKVGWKVGDTDLNWVKKAKTRQVTKINVNKWSKKNKQQQQQQQQEDWICEKRWSQVGLDVSQL